MKDAAGGEGGHGVAKPDGVIYRYISNQATIAGVKGIQIKLPRDGSGRCSGNARPSSDKLTPRSG
jgi:hypothetical protein